MPTTPPADSTPDPELPEEVGGEDTSSEAEHTPSAPESAAKLGQLVGGLYGKLSGDPEAGRRLGERAGENLRSIVSEVVAEAEKRQGAKDPRDSERAPSAAGEAMKRAAAESLRLAQERRKAQLDEKRQASGAPKPDPSKPPAGVPTSMDGVNAAEALEATLKRAQESVRTGLERAVEELAARGSDIASQVAEVRAQRRHVASGEDVWTRATADSRAEDAAAAEASTLAGSGGDVQSEEDPNLVAAEVLTVLLRERGYASLSHALANGSEGASEAKRVVGELAKLGLLQRPAAIPDWEGHELVKISETLATCRVCEQTMSRDATSECSKRPAR